jgi:hypothetical protein
VGDIARAIATRNVFLAGRECCGTGEALPSPENTALPEYTTPNRPWNFRVRIRAEMRRWREMLDRDQPRPGTPVQKDRLIPDARETPIWHRGVFGQSPNIPLGRMRGVKSSLRRETDVPRDLLRAQFRNVIELALPYSYPEQQSTSET